MDVNPIRTQEEFDQAFAGALKTAMENKYSLAVDPEVHQVMKTNGAQDAITVHFKECNIAPTIYTSKLYDAHKKGIKLDTLVEESVNIVYAAHIDSPVLPTFNLEEAKKHITLTLVNRSKNLELLQRVPHTDILEGELAVVPRWYISDDASFIVTRDIAKEMKLTDEEILRIGMDSIDTQTFEIKPIQQVLAESIGIECVDAFPPMDIPIMVVTNESRIRGANVLLSKRTLDRVHDLVGDYIIIGSSIHEILCLPSGDGIDPAQIRDIVYDVNRNTLSEEEFLSDAIFSYDGNLLRLVGDTLEFDKMEIESPSMDPSAMKMKF